MLQLGFCNGRDLSAEITNQIIALQRVVAEGGDLGRLALCHARSDRGQRPRLQPRTASMQNLGSTRRRRNDLAVPR